MFALTRLPDLVVGFGNISFGEGIQGKLADSAVAVNGTSSPCAFCDTSGPSSICTFGDITGALAVVFSGILKIGGSDSM